MKTIHIPNQRPTIIIRMVLLVILMLVLVSCSQGIRMKNLVNYPIQLSSLDALDTLKISPDIVKYSGSEVSSYRIMAQDIHILEIGRASCRERV